MIKDGTPLTVRTYMGLAYGDPDEDDVESMVPYGLIDDRPGAKPGTIVGIEHFRDAVRAAEQKAAKSRAIDAGWDGKPYDPKGYDPNLKD